MKSILITTVLLLTTSLTTIAMAENNLLLRSSIDKECKIQNKQIVNWIYNSNIKEESVTDLHFAFYARWGRCVNKEYKFFIINPDAEVEFWTRKVNIPWKKDPLSFDVEHICDDLIKVTVDIDKLKLFKMKSAKNVTFNFTPKTGYPFHWNISFVKKTNTETLITFKGK